MIKGRILYWSITVALAGFLFGFDTVVISGADLTLEALWDRGETFHGFVVMASALWGTVIGAMFGGIPTDKLGRRKTLFWIGVLYFVSAVGSAMANDPWVFAVFRTQVPCSNGSLPERWGKFESSGFQVHRVVCGRPDSRVSRTCHRSDRYSAAPWHRRHSSAGSSE